MDVFTRHSTLSGYCTRLDRARALSQKNLTLGLLMKVHARSLKRRTLLTLSAASVKRESRARTNRNDLKVRGRTVSFYVFTCFSLLNLRKLSDP